MKSLLNYLCIGVSALFLSLSANAQAVAPDELVKRISDEVLDIVRSDPNLRNGDPRSVVARVEEVVTPHFNFRRMTSLAVGREGWRGASSEQQQRLVDGFYGLLVRIYSNALTQYKDQTVHFKPFRMSAGDTTVRVQSEIRQSGAQPIAVDYVLERSADSWKIFDIFVAGVSLVTNYRGEFSEQIRTGGIDGLIRSLEAGTIVPDEASQS
ncbi:MAG: ABC transporter substrate-binding protein [Zoogloeaceae bacterium]|nr:ABC transporter substrate-binding protein [Zoogloeaceae bacterium]